MNSTAKGLIFIVVGVLALLWFAYEALIFVASHGTPPGENPALYIGLMALKLVWAVSCFVAAVSAFRKK